jgi:CheY-like chemotaxis protein
MKIKVLHVDDEELELKFTKLFLEISDNEISVTSVTDPHEVIELLKKDHYDLLLSDYKMNQMTGIELGELVRFFTDIPIILYTGFGSEEVAEKAFKVGINGYFKKGTCPSQYDSLADQVRKMVEKAQRFPNLEENTSQYSLI